MSPLRHLVGAAALVLLVGSIVGLVGRDDESPAVAAGPGEVVIAGFAFAPDPLTVRVGATVTWTNSDGNPHTVDAAGGLLHSGSLDEGATFEHTFDAAGTFAYVCAFHPFMKGTVEVTG